MISVQTKNLIHVKKFSKTNLKVEKKRKKKNIIMKEKTDYKQIDL